MKKSTLVLVAALFLVLGGAGGYLLVSFRKQPGPTAPKPMGSSPAVVRGDLTYKDESGFSFAYPKGFKVSDVTPASEEYYSQLKVSRKEEFLLISVKDGQSSGYENADLVGAVVLAGLPAKQYAQGGKLVTVAIDGGVVYLIEGPKDDGEWEEVQNLVASSFSLTEQTAGAASADQNTIYEEEEVVE